MSHNGPTAEADDVSTPAGAGTSPLQQSVIGEVQAFARHEHQRQPLPIAPPRRIPRLNLDGAVSTESVPALGRKLFNYVVALTSAGYQCSTCLKLLV